MRQSPRGEKRDRADLRAVGQAAALELLDEEAAVEVFQPVQQRLRGVFSGECGLRQPVDFLRSEAEAKHIVEVEIMQLIGTDKGFRLLRDRAGLRRGSSSGLTGVSRMSSSTRRRAGLWAVSAS